MSTTEERDAIVIATDAPPGDAARQTHAQRPALLRECRGRFKAPDETGGSRPEPDSGRTESGSYWVKWANTNAGRSASVGDLDSKFKSKVQAFIAALEEAGAKVRVTATRRSATRAYLSHWAWKIYQGKCKPSDPPPMKGLDIEWDHGDLNQSKKAAAEMVKGLGLAVPPRATEPPPLSGNAIRGMAIDMSIRWKGKLVVRKRDGTPVEIRYMQDPNKNALLQKVAASYGVNKNKGDASLWSHNGR